MQSARYGLDKKDIVCSRVGLSALEREYQLGKKILPDFNKCLIYDIQALSIILYYGIFKPRVSLSSNPLLLPNSHQWRPKEIK